MLCVSYRQVKKVIQVFIMITPLPLLEQHCQVKYYLEQHFSPRQGILKKNDFHKISCKSS